MLKRAEQMKEKKAKRRKSQMKKITNESRKTLMMYNKTSNVLEKFAKKQLEEASYSSDNDSDETRYKTQPQNNGNKERTFLESGGSPI